MVIKALRIDPNIAPDLVAPVHKATTELEHVVGDAAERVGVVWTPGLPDADLHPTVMLSLSDKGVERRQAFTADTFREEWFLQLSLRKLWDDVLAERMRLQWQKVIDSFGESGED